MTTLRALPPAARHQPHSYSSHLAISRFPRRSIICALRSENIATAITLAGRVAPGIDMLGASMNGEQTNGVENLAAIEKAKISCRK
jgi:hypothetical protein